MLLEHSGFRGLAAAVGDGVRDAIAAGQTTGDLGGNLSTEAFTNAVVEATRKNLAG
jgi:isocitrate/isopropylmalate dehydrogenase